jgi:t-SNARE complex subunit (syntaxin)
MITFKEYVLFSLLTEELTDAQKKKVDAWASKMTAKSYGHSHKVFGSNTNARLTIPLTNSEAANVETTLHPDVQKFLNSRGYNVSGDAATRKVKIVHPTLGPQEKEVHEKIGKALEKSNAPIDIKKKYMNSDSKQGSKLKDDDLEVVISRHPYDVAGMSTDRGWTSCMDMEDGCNVNFLKNEIKNGTHVAYLVRKDDTDLKTPIARIAIKQYESKDGHVSMLADKTYGLSHAGFVRTVNDWIHQNFPIDESKEYELRKGSYADNVPRTIVNNFKEKLNSTNLMDRVIAIRHPNATAEHINKALDDKDAYVRRAAIEHPNATVENISKALDDKDAYVKWHAIKHPNATAEHINKALDDKDGYVRQTAIKHPNATAEHINKALNDKDEDVRRAAIRHPNATAEHINKALDDKDGYVRRVAIQHPNATAEHINKALDDKDADVRRVAIQHPNATAEHISKALDDKDADVRRVAIQHPNATAEHISKALNDKDLDVKWHAIKHPNATAEHISKALNDKDEYVRQAAIQHPNATAEHINKALDDKDGYVRQTAIQHPNATVEHINKALDDKDADVRRAAIQHPNATAEHINKALDDKDRYVRRVAMSIKNKFEKHHQQLSAHKQALQMGLEYYGFGRYGHNNTVTHKVHDGILRKVS